MTSSVENIKKKKWIIACGVTIVMLLAFLYFLDFGNFDWGNLSLLPQLASNAINDDLPEGFSQGSPELHQKKSSPMSIHDQNSNINVTKSVIMCLIFTTVEQYDRKGLAVKLTWLQRCNYYAFFYSKSNGRELKGAYALDVPEGRDHLTAKTMKAFQVAYKTYKDKVDWYVKADDDTYFIMENLHYLLSHYDPSKPVYLGHTSQDFLKNGYNSGGAGYVLSKAATQMLAEKGDGFPKSCPVDGGTEDLDIGRCLESFRIFPEETRDSFHRITFHPDHPLKLLLGNGDAMSVYQYTIQNYTFGHYKGIKVLSPYTISFHYMEPGHMYMYDFLLYDLKRYH